MAFLLEKLKLNKFINFNDVLIIGDSFATQRTTDTDWPKLLVSRLCSDFSPKRIPRGSGFNGASWWSSRKLLYRELKKHIPKLLIMTHTEMQRIPNDDDYGLNSSSVFNVEEYTRNIESTIHPDHIPKEVLLAGQEFYKHLFCKDFFIWAQKQWFLEIDTIVEKYSIPFVIHFHSFEPWDGPQHIFKNGITFNQPLWNICDDIKLISQDRYKSITEEIQTVDGDIWQNNSNRNHFSVENNIKLADQILDAINNYSHGVRNLQL